MGFVTWQLRLDIRCLCAIDHNRKHLAPQQRLIVNEVTGDIYYMQNLRIVKIKVVERLLCLRGKTQFPTIDITLYPVILAAGPTNLSVVLMFSLSSAIVILYIVRKKN